MKGKHTQRWTMALGLGLSLGLAFALSLVVSRASAQAHGSAGGTPPPEIEIEARWLILDTARPVEETLPPLLKALAALKAGGVILDFDPTPQSSAPAGVPGLRVVGLPGAWPRLGYLPGVLAVGDSLPPPPPTGGRVPLFHSTAIITGRVTEASSGTSLAGAKVSIYDAISYAPIDDLYTDANGYYSVTVTAPFDKIKARFEAPQYATEWYSGQSYFSTAEAVDLLGGGMRTNINGSLEKAGVISGAVRFEGSGDPVAYVFMDVYGTDGSFCGYTWSEANGQYRINLRAGTYKLSYEGEPIVAEWYQDKTSQTTADIVTVTAGQTTTVNVEVTAAGWITGLVTDESSGLPVPTLVFVAVSDSSGDFANVVTTDPAGAYAAGALGTGDYKLYFFDIQSVVGEAFYYDEYYDDQPDWSQADLVAVTAGITTPNINAALTPITPLGTITGTIEEVSWPMVRSPLDFGDNVDIYFYNAGSGALVYTHYFWGDGTTTIYSASLPAGRYKALFVQDKAIPDYAPQWYDNKTSYASADVITVTAGQVTTDVSALLRLPWLGSRGCISGVVTAAVDGTPLAGVEVRVYTAHAQDYHYVDTDANGEYQICNLLYDYQVQFVKNPYIPQWYDGAATRTEATTVTVSAGATVANINAALDLGGCVSGQITDLGGLLRPRAWGRILDPAGERMEFYNPRWLYDLFVPDGDASFVVCGLPSGDYVVTCRDGDLSDSEPVTVIAGQETSGVRCVLARRLYLPLVLRDD